MSMAAAHAEADTGAQVSEASERFELFASAHHDRALRLAYRLLQGDRAAAEDVVQEAFLRAHRGLARFRSEASLSTWFTRILLREVQRHRRWQRARRIWSTDSLAERELPDRPAPSPDAGLRRRIGAALGRLSARQRDAFVLVHMEGYTVAETAALLGAASGTVKTHVHRAMQALRRDLADLSTSDAAGALP